jgi:hypothetical protein
MDDDHLPPRIGLAPSQRSYEVGSVGEVGVSAFGAAS